MEVKIFTINGTTFYFIPKDRIVTVSPIKNNITIHFN